MLPNNQLQPNWLNRTKPNVSILKLDNCLIQEIQENAFTGARFLKLRSLTITDTRFRNIRKHSFLDLKSLVDLVLYCPTGSLELNVEARALEGLRSLKTLSLKNFNISANALLNLIGSNAALLEKLVTLDLSQNFLSILPRSAFINVPNLSTLDLDRSNLKTIHKDAFFGCKTLRELNLRRNNLTFLPEGVFDHFVSVVEERLLLGNNPWNCSCNFKWFQTYYYESHIIDKTSPLFCSNGNPLASSHFCPDVTYPEHQPPSTNSSFQQEVRFLEFGKVLSFSCHDVKHYILPTDYKSSKMYFQEVVVRNGCSANLTYYELQQDPLIMVVNSHINLTGYALIRFTANDKKEAHCVTNFYKTVVLEGLAHGTTYIFSLVYQYEQYASPRSTFSITTEPEWKQRAWILNKHLALSVTLLVSIGILIACLSAFLSYIFIRRHNKLLAGKIERKNTTAPKMLETKRVPEEYEKPIYWEPSNHGYLTPNCHRYTRVDYGPLLDPSDKNSTRSSCVELTVQKLREWDKQLHKDDSTRSSSEYEMYTELKPPLPPPNPARKQSNEKKDVEN